ncbi:MAG TPA: DUF6797 domain-containing protein, partial [Pirellulales bacterium]|nr:DUF6797 domain-containing protein [Pirellulales bacterium]
MRQHSGSFAMKGWCNLFNLGFAILLLIAALSLAGGTASGAPPVADTLERRLLAEPPADLAKAARKLGDPTRGALVFYQPGLACAKCHVGDGARPTLGPDLARHDQRPPDELLVESVLSPSKTIRKGFEAVTIVTGDGVALTGLLVEDGRDSIVIRDAAQDGKPVTVAKHDIDQQANAALSLMPGGLVNQLADRAQFLDLVRYLMEIADGGPARARELRPAAALLVTPPLPEYEERIDHAGLIGELDRESFSRGSAIYLRLCVNCHGTQDRPGSLPTSLRFATGKFKNGCDPYSIYQTLTKGFGQMTPQTWLVPRQKYDVIHYLREAYLKEHNPTQFTRVDRDYLVKLPRGDSRGPEPSRVEPWVQMDYGPSLINTYEVGDDGSNFAYKGIAVRLDAGPGGVSQGRHWMVFDHDTMRVAAAWSGEQFIDFNGIQFNGRHEVHPRVVGQVQFVNPIGPGWANPADGRFDDPRPRGRDDRPYGPLPRNWARYQGLYHFGQQTIISYTLGDVAVLESPGLAGGPTPLPVFTRTFNLGPRATELVLQVAHQPAAKPVTIESAGVVSGSAVEFAPAVQTNGAEPAVELAFDGTVVKSDSNGKPRALRAVVAGVTPLPPGAEWLSTDSGNLRLKLPAGDGPLRFTLWITGTGLNNGPTFDAAAVASAVAIDNPEKDLAPCTHGGPPRWPATLATQGHLGADDGP